MATGWVRALAIFLLLFSACRDAPRPGGGAPRFQDDLGRESLRRSIHQSLEFLAAVPPDRVVGTWPRRLTAREVRESLIEFLEVLALLDQPERLLEEIRSRFELHESPGGPRQGEVLFTGYYRPVIEGKLRETSVYRFPIYGRPDDLVAADLGRFVAKLRGESVVGRIEGDRLVPYLSRYDIDGLGGLKGRGLEIAWARDPVDLFFLHIQGSGLLRLEDGRHLHLSYAGSNGRPYTSIGRLLISRGRIRQEELSMQRLRRYLKEHPAERDRLLAENERYIFFRFTEDGPLGSLGVPLTAGRSVATDARLFPKGALGFIAAERPVLDAAGNLVGWRPFSRFVLNQDTGSSIRGAGRVDLYFGGGPDAGTAAGHMRSKGRLFFLTPRRGTDISG